MSPSPLPDETQAGIASPEEISHAPGPQDFTISSSATDLFAASKRRSFGDRDLELEDISLLHDTESDYERSERSAQLVHGGTSSIIEAFLNCCNSIIGAGIIGLPFALKEAGFFVGIGLLAILTVVVDWTIRILIKSSRLSGQKTTYQGLVEYCFGRVGMIAISVFQFLFAFGAMAAYTVIVGDTIPSVLLFTFPSIPTLPVLWLLGSRKFMIFATTVSISFPLSLYRDMSKLAKASALALVAILVIVITTLVEGPNVAAELKGDPSFRWSLANSEVIQAIGVISFAFVCHHNTFLIYGSLHTPTLDRFAIVTHLSTGTSLLASSVLAVSGYWVFTKKTQANILNNFPHDKSLVNFARLCFGMNMFTTLPLETFVAREVIEHYFWPGQTSSTARHFALTSALVFTAMIIGIVTCDLGFVLELTGGFSATALATPFTQLSFFRLAAT